MNRKFDPSKRTQKNNQGLRLQGASGAQVQQGVPRTPQTRMQGGPNNFFGNKPSSNSPLNNHAQNKLNGKGASFQAPSNNTIQKQGSVTPDGDEGKNFDYTSQDRTESNVIDINLNTEEQSLSNPQTVMSARNQAGLKNYNK